MFYKDNWFTWYYDGVEKGPKTSFESVFTIKTKPTITRAIKSYKEELLLNASLTRDAFVEPFDLMLSGGVDSEVVLRCYHELRIPVNVFTFRYENDYNILDLQHATRICNELGIKLNIIDFNLKKFFENDAYAVWKTGYYLSAGQLPNMKTLDYLDNIPVMGNANPLWVCNNKEWRFELDEKYHSQSIYCSTVNKRSIIDWYEYSPELILAYMDHRITRGLLSRPGDWKTFETAKYMMYKTIWPSIEIRPKYVGFEGNSPPGYKNSKPGFMLDFETTYIKKNQGAVFSYSNDELVKMLRGDLNE